MKRLSVYVGNTDFSVVSTWQLYCMLYDFDMSGFINPSYAVVNETSIDNIRDRKYRDFNRDDDDTLKLSVFVAQKQAMFDLMKNMRLILTVQKNMKKPHFCRNFFEIIEDGSNVIINKIS